MDDYPSSKSKFYNTLQEPFSLNEIKFENFNDTHVSESASEIVQQCDQQLDQQGEHIITCLIISHGYEMNNIINSNIDKNIRILSRAGVPGCLGVCGPSDYDNLFDEYENNMDYNLSTYQKLEKIQQNFLSPEQCFKLYNTTYQHNLNKKIGKYSLDIFTKKAHSRIYKPVNEHLYSFTFPENFNQGIHILEIKNPVPNNIFSYKNNLLDKRFFLDEFNNPEKVKDNIRQALRLLFNYMKFPIIDIKTDYESVEDIEQNFIPRNQNEEIIKTKFFEKYVKNIKKKILKDYAQKMFTKQNINEALKIYKDQQVKQILDIYIINFLDYFEENNYNCDYILELLDLIKNNYFDSVLLKRQITSEELQSNRNLVKKFYPRIFSNQVDSIIFISNVAKLYGELYSVIMNQIYSGKINTVEIKLSTIINYLKSKGFTIINIIDLSCRSVEDKKYETPEGKEKINEIKEMEEMGIEDPQDLYEKNKGGKKSKKNKKTRKYRRSRQYRKYRRTRHHRK
jgi:hypothetical protein